MLKEFRLAILLVCALAPCAPSGAAAREWTTAAQETARAAAGETEWIVYSDAPTDEFTVELPEQPLVYHTGRGVREKRGTFPEGETARLYTAYKDDVIYLVVSYDNPRPERDETLAFFVADIASSFLPRGQYSSREIKLNELTGREFTFGDGGGHTARFYLTPNHAYMLATLGVPEAGAESKRRFLDSFRVNVKPRPKRNARRATKQSRDEDAPSTGNPPKSAPLPTGDNRAGERPDGEPVDYNRVFSAKEVTKKALIVLKPEPPYTEEARRNNVSGFLRLRATLSTSGKVTDIEVVKKLPDGLTENAIRALRTMRFVPAWKDGRRVAQSVVVEYHFNIY